MFVRLPRAVAALIVVGTAATALGGLPSASASAAAPAAHSPSPATTTVPALTGWHDGHGTFRLRAGSRVVVGDPALRSDATTFAADIDDELGRHLPVVPDSVKVRAGDIVLNLDKHRAGLGTEGYTLNVSDAIRVTGRTTDGAFWGTRTILQLLHGSTSIPAGSATDVPTYPQRGVGVCTCYIHVTMPWLERLIKDESYLKLNQLQLEIKVKSTAHPEANEWGYYTPDEIKRLQRVADRYHVTLVPEVNSPGHIDPWIRNDPDLQLTDSSGVKQPSRLDITKPEAYDFLTSVIDEYFKVFHTPYWHMGADEYMLGSDYASYPQMAAYAKEKFGPDAVPQDAYVDFVNRIDAYVRSKGKTLRMWNDGVTDSATIPLNSDITVEHWLSGGVLPSQLIADGHQVMNSAYSLYNVRGGFKMDTGSLYDQGWTPLSFEGEQLTSAHGVVGSKITLWPDNGSGNTENEIQDEVRMPLRFIAQATWDSDPEQDATYADFTARADTVGRAPGFDNTDRTPVEPGRYELAVDGADLTGATADPGAQAVLGHDRSDFLLSTTADGYYTVRTGNRCLEARQGRRDVNTPLEPGTPITLETCNPGNRLQRWQLAVTDEGATLTNAITQMVAVLDGSGLVQQVPDGHTAQAFSLVGAVNPSAVVSRRTVGPGESADVTVSVKNGTDTSVTGLSSTVTGPDGWTLAPATQSSDTLAPGATWTATFTGTWTGTQGHDTEGLVAHVGFTDGSGAHTDDLPIGWEPSTTIAGDLAEGETASQISTAYGGTADRAVDGNTSGSWGDSSLSHTEENIDQPWWQVDLGQSEWIGSVELFNRTDCCSERLTDPVVLLSDTPLPDDFDAALATPGVVVARVDGQVGSSVRVPISGTKRYVRVQLPTTGTLSLAEVVVRAPE